MVYQLYTKDYANNKIKFNIIIILQTYMYYLELVY
jgi:hypothetical protein